MVDLLSIAAIAAGTSFIMWQSPRSSKLDEVFEVCGLHTKKAKPLLIKSFAVKHEGKKIGHHYIYTIPYGKSVEDFRKVDAEILAATGAAACEVYTKGGNKVHIELYNEPLPQLIKYQQIDVPEGMALPIPIGQTYKGFKIIDLAELPHLLVGGSTGFGKSNFLHQVIATLANNPNVRLFIIDMKRAEFSYMKKYSWFAKTSDEAEKVLKYLHSEMFRRLDIFEAKGIVKMQEYKGNDLPYLVLVVDEFSQLCPELAKEDEDKKQRKRMHKMLVDILSIARAPGIHVILSTQRPDADILPGQLKANISGTMAFKVRNEVNSRILLDNDRAAKLEVKGRAIYQDYAGEVEVQTMYLPIADARKILPKEPITTPEQARRQRAETNTAGII